MWSFLGRSHSAESPALAAVLLHAWTRPGLITGYWVGALGKFYINIHVGFYMHVHAYICACAYLQRRSTCLTERLLTRREMMALESSFSAQVFHLWLLLFIRKAPGTYVLRDRCSPPTRSRIEDPERLKRSRARSKSGPVKPGWLTVQHRLNVSSRASYPPPRLSSWFLRKCLRLDPPDTVAAGQQVMLQ